MMQTVSFDAEFSTERRLVAFLPAGPDGRPDPEALANLDDILDLGNSRRLPPGEETSFAVLEEKAYARIRATAQVDGAEVPGTIDRSSESTARRIVNFATRFLEGFAKGRGGLDEGVLDEFLGIIGGAIDEGFAQAQAVLEGFAGGSLPDEIDGTIARTRDLIDEYLAEFRERTLEKIRSGETTDAKAPEEVTA